MKIIVLLCGLAASGLTAALYAHGDHRAGIEAGHEACLHDLPVCLEQQ